MSEEQQTQTVETTQSTEATQAESQAQNFDSKAAAERFSKLAALEKQKLAERQSWVKEKQAFDQEKTELMKYKEMIERIKKNDVSVLDELNPDYYTEATRYKLNQSEPTLDYRLSTFEEKIAKMLDEKLTAKEQEIISREEQNRKIQQQALRESWVKEINQYFKKDELKEKFNLMLDVDGFEEMILEGVEKKGLKLDEAAEQLEAALQKQLKETVFKHKSKALDWLLDEMGISKEQFDKLTPKVKNEIKTEALKLGTESKTLSNIPNSIVEETPKKFKTKQESLEEVAKLIKKI